MGFRSVLRFLPLPLEVEDAALATFLALSMAAFLMPSEPFMVLRRDSYRVVLVIQTSSRQGTGAGAGMLLKLIIGRGGGAGACIQWLRDDV